MRSWTLFTVLFTSLICLTCEGQSDFTLLLKGQKNPYDTAVAIEVHQYRLIRQKVAVGDTYIGSLRKTIDSLNAQMEVLYYLANTQGTLIAAQQDFGKKNEQAFDGLSARFDKLAEQLNAPKAWYERPLVIFGGAVVAVEVIHFLTRR